MMPTISDADLYDILRDGTCTSFQITYEHTRFANWKHPDAETTIPHPPRVSLSYIKGGAEHTAEFHCTPKQLHIIEEFARRLPDRTRLPDLQPLSFVNKLRIMYGLDAHEIKGVPRHYVSEFIMDPYRTIMKLDEKNLSIVWNAILKRERGDKP